MRAPRPTALWLAGAILLGTAALAIALMWGPGDDFTLEERVSRVASSLRCPECQNLSVDDSPSGLAAEMRREIARRLRSGASEEQVRDFFVERYGQWILLSPKASGLGIVVWLTPVLAVLAGGLVVGMILRRRRLRRQPVAVDAATHERIDRELESLGADE